MITSNSVYRKRYSNNYKFVETQKIITHKDDGHFANIWDDIVGSSISRLHILIKFSKGPIYYLNDRMASHKMLRINRYEYFMHGI